MNTQRLLKLAAFRDASPAPSQVADLIEQYVGRSGTASTPAQ